MSVVWEYIDHAYIFIDQGIGLVHDTKRRLAAIYQHERRSHAVGTRQSIRNGIPDAKFRERFVRVSTRGYAIRITDR